MGRAGIIKSSIALVFVLVIAMQASAIIQEPFPTSAAFIEITLVNQEPDPVRPGQVMEVRFKIQNDGEQTFDDVEVEILPEAPFTLYRKEAVQNIGKLRGAQTGADAVILDWELRVAEDAVEGERELKLRYRIGNQAWITYDHDEFLIDVRTPDIVLLVKDVETTPRTIEPGKPATLSIGLDNTADSFIQNVKVSLNLTDIPISPLGTASETQIYQIPAKEKTKTVFDVITLPDAASNTYKIPVDLTYEDEIGNTYSTTTLIGVTVGAQPDVDIFLEETDLTMAGETGLVTAQVVNKGLIDVKFITIELLKHDSFERLSPIEVYLGDIEPDDFETADFEVHIKKGTTSMPLVFKITGMDANNNEISKTVEKSIKVYSSKEAKELGLETAGVSGITIIVIIIVLGLIVYFIMRRRRRRKK